MPESVDGGEPETIPDPVAVGTGVQQHPDAEQARRSATWVV
ncbi:hypothetical protein [Candidatus Poriferisodalis sp.]